MNRSQIDKCADIEKLRAECVRLRQGLWDCYAAMGADTDGDATPDALVFPHLSRLVLSAAKELMGDYEQACARGLGVMAHVV